MSLLDKLKETDMIAVIEREMTGLLDGRSLENKRLERVSAANENDPEAWFELGMNVIDEALRYEDLALEKARLQYQQEHPELVEDVDVTINTDIPELYTFYAHALMCFDKVLELDSEYYGVQCQRGVCFANMHEFEKAESAFLQALKDDDEDANAAFNLALLYQDNGKEDKSAEYFALAQDLQGE